MDTGNSYLGNPEVHYGRSASRIKEMLEKNKNKKLPNLKYIIEGDEYELEPKYYMLDGMMNTQTADDMLQNSWFISMSVKVKALKDPLYILGQSFLSKYYNIYNFEKSLVGFAKAKHDSSK